MSNPHSAPECAGVTGHAPPKADLTGLVSTAFAHPLDRSASQALRKLKGFDRVVAKLLEWQGEQAAYVELNACGIRVTKRQLPGLHALLVDACRVLDMTVPELFVKPGGFNAYTAGHNNPYIVLTTDLVDGLSDAELTVVIAHELGHIKCSHVLYKSMVSILTDVGTSSVATSKKPAVLLGLRLVLPYIERGLTQWNQRSELSADRAAMLVVQDEETCLRMMLKLAGAPIRLVDQLDTAEFLEQAAHLANLTAESSVANRTRQSMVDSSTHPLTVERARQLHAWIQDGGFAAVLSDPTGTKAPQETPAVGAVESD
jgi:Zn-dependent protease with chaperone function